jgi:hypothetical protein
MPRSLRETARAREPPLLVEETLIGWSLGSGLALLFVIIPLAPLDSRRPRSPFILVRMSALSRALS